MWGMGEQLLTLLGVYLLFDSSSVRQRHGV